MKGSVWASVDVALKPKQVFDAFIDEIFLGLADRGVAWAVGFEAKVEYPSLFGLAKKVGVPKPDLQMFIGTRGSQLLVCRKP